jgi:hypothetical protein
LDRARAIARAEATQKPHYHNRAKVAAAAAAAAGGTSAGAVRVPFLAPSAALCGFAAAAASSSPTIDVSLEDSRDARTFFLPMIQRMMLSFGDVHYVSHSAGTAASLRENGRSALVWPSIYTAMAMQEELEKWVGEVLACIPLHGKKSDQAALLKELFPLQSSVFTHFKHARRRATLADADSGATAQILPGEGDSEEEEDDEEEEDAGGEDDDNGNAEMEDDDTETTEPKKGSKRKASGVPKRGANKRNKRVAASMSATTFDNEQNGNGANDVAEDANEEDEDADGLAAVAATNDGDDAVPSALEGLLGELDAKDESISAAVSSAVGAAAGSSTRASYDIYFRELDLHLGPRFRRARQNELTQHMNYAEYEQFARCRETAFSKRAAKPKLAGWLGSRIDTLHPTALQLLCFLAWDRVGMLVELCAGVRDCSRHARRIEQPFTPSELQHALTFLDAHPLTARTTMQRRQIAAATQAQLSVRAKGNSEPQVRSPPPTAAAAGMTAGTEECKQSDRERLLSMTSALTPPNTTGAATDSLAQSSEAKGAAGRKRGAKGARDTARKRKAKSARE